MKKAEYILMGILALISNISIAQTWQWSNQAGGAYSDFPDKSCIDANANFYVAGRFSSNPCYFNLDTLSCNGSNDIFIAKYNPSGIEQWVKSYGGGNMQLQSDGAYSMSYDSYSNSILVSGTFWGTCIIDNDTLFSNGQNDGYLAKFDLNGNLVWAKKVGGTGSDVSPALCVGTDGNIFVEYTFDFQASIDTLTVSAGVYFAKYNSAGDLLWVKKKFNYNNGYVASFSSIKVIDNKIFGVGMSNVNSFTVDTVNVISDFPNYQTIVGCFDTSGTALWIKACAGQPNYIGYDNIAVDNGKNCFVTSNFGSTAFFENDTLHVAGFVDMFLAKFDSTGQYLWAIQPLASIHSVSCELSLDIDGSVYLCGGFSGSATFGAYTINSVASGDMFVARFDTTGNCYGVRHLGDAVANCIQADNNGNFYVAGNFSNTITFDSNPSLISHGQGDIYVAKSSAITGIGGRQSAPNNQLLIYANPNKGICTITIPDDFKNEKNLTLTLYDNTGKVIQKTPVQMQADKVKVNLEQEATGVYNVTLSNAKKSYNGKIVFE